MTRLQIFSCGFLFCTSLFTASCYYDVEEVLYPPNDCDTTNVEYNAFIVPLLENNCYVCHGNGANQGGVQIGTYNQIKIMVDNGRFLGAISHDNGFSPMPQGTSKLLDCQVQQVAAWINAGALNN